MFIYEKKLQFPVKISTPNPKLAAVIISQYGGPDGELGPQCDICPSGTPCPTPSQGPAHRHRDRGAGPHGDGGRHRPSAHPEPHGRGGAELSHLRPYFVDHTTGVYPTAASGFPWTAGSIQSTGDVITDLTEDLAAEQKARLTYDNILRLSDDPDVNNVIRFLRGREIVHFQRFGECLRMCKEKMNAKTSISPTPPSTKFSPETRGRG